MGEPSEERADVAWEDEQGWDEWQRQQTFYADVHTHWMPPAIETFTWAELEENADATSWLIDKVVPAEGITVLGGQPGSAKTTVAFTMIFSWLQRRDWFGVPTHADPDGMVLYFAAEAMTNNLHLLAGFREEFKECGEIAPDQLRFVQHALDFQDAQTITDIIETATCLSTTLDRPLIAIFVDTLSKNFGGKDENSTADMQRFVNLGCGRIRAALGCAVLPIHHTDKEGKDLRGNSALKADCDAAWMFEASGDSIKMKCEKLRSIGTDRKFKLEKRPARRYLRNDQGERELTEYTYPWLTLDEAKTNGGDSATGSAPEEISNTPRYRLKLIFGVFYDAERQKSNHPSMRDLMEHVKAPYHRHNVVAAAQDPPDKAWRVPSDSTIRDDIRGMIKAKWVEIEEGECASGRDRTYILTEKGIAEAIRVLGVDALEQMRSLIPGEASEHGESMQGEGT